MTGPHYGASTSINSSEQNDKAPRLQGVGPSQQQVVDEYLQAFPSANLDALAVQFAVASVATFLRQGIERTIREVGFDLTRQKYTALRMLYLSPDRSLPKRQIAERMHVTGAYVSQLLQPLESDGWIVREVDPADRRATTVTLTEVGVERCEQLVPRVLDYILNSCGVLSPSESVELQRLLGKILSTTR